MRSVRSRHVRSPRRRLLALSTAVAALAVAAPVSGASAALPPVGFPGAGTGFTPIDVPGGVAQGGQANAPSGCVGANAPSGVGDAGATSNQLCGVTLAFVGPSIGQVSTAIGPTIIGSTVLAPVTVSSGPVAVSSVP
jgi:hypothetical protein